jgi:protein-disulfide isomerase
MMRILIAATALLAMVSLPADAAPKKKAPIARPRPAAAPAPKNWLRTVVRTPEGGMRMGNPAAKIALIEYGSRTCPHCALFDKEGVPVITSKFVATGQMSYEFRDYPVHGALDLPPILLGQCVAPSQYFPMLAQMMAAQEQLLKKPDVPAAEQERLRTAPLPAVIAYLANHYGYTAFVTQRGVTPVKARACLADPKMLEAVGRSTDAANAKYKISGTPTFIVNGVVAENTYDWKALEPILRAAGAH